MYSNVICHYDALIYGSNLILYFQVPLTSSNHGLKVKNVSHKSILVFTEHTFSSWSQLFHLRDKSVVSSPLLSGISYGAGSVKGTVRLVILTTPPFDLLMPSDNIISVC